MLDDAAKVNELAETLASYKCVSRFDHRDEIEGGTLAHAFRDLESSFRKFLSELLPKLVDGNLSEAEACDLLHLIGEELRHIHYHLRDSQFYQYLWEDAIPVDRRRSEPDNDE